MAFTDTYRLYLTKDLVEKNIALAVSDTSYDSEDFTAEYFIPYQTLSYLKENTMGEIVIGENKFNPTYIPTTLVIISFLISQYRNVSKTLTIVETVEKVTDPTTSEINIVRPIFEFTYDFDNSVSVVISQVFQY